MKKKITKTGDDLNELTPMQLFAVIQIREKGPINANYLASLWAEKQGRRDGSSRRMFGTTTAAYKTLRILEEKEFVRKINETVGDYSSYELTY